MSEKTLDQILRERRELQSIVAVADEVLHYMDRIQQGEVEVPMPDNVFERANAELVEPLRDVVLEFRREVHEDLEKLNNSKVVSGG